jgi:hypothetical protein
MIDLTPLQWDWPAVTRGDTYPACQITETLADTALERVRIKIKLSGSDSASLTLDSDATGITITTSTAGAWDFTINEISTTSLAAGFYVYDLETTDDAGTVRTEFSGSWPILPQTTD